MFVDNTQQCFAFTPQTNFPAHNLNFDCRWRWLDRIKATFQNLFYFTWLSRVTKLASSNSIRQHYLDLRKSHWSSQCFGRIHISFNDGCQKIQLKCKFRSKKYGSIDQIVSTYISLLLSYYSCPIYNTYNNKNHKSVRCVGGSKNMEEPIRTSFIEEGCASFRAKLWGS